MAKVSDFATVRVSGPEEWRVIREAYAETYPVRPLLNRIDELEAALDWALGNGVTACRGEVSGSYSFVIPGENSDDYDDIDPPTNLTGIVGEAAVRCFAQQNISEQPKGKT